MEELYAQTMAIRSYLENLIEDDSYTKQPADVGVKLLQKDVAKAVEQLNYLLNQML